jgi:putative salt-induced outer membrane protein
MLKLRRRRNSKPLLLSLNKIRARGILCGDGGAMMRPVGWSVFVLLWTAAMAAADVVTLKNGDRVTGALVDVKGGNLDLKSEVLGSLTIPLAQVASFSTAGPAAVLVKGQKIVEGQLALQPSGDWQVTENGTAQTVAAANVDLIMPADAYQELVEHTAKPWQDWKGTASLGYSLQRGNQQTNNFATTINAVRERPETPIFERHWRTGFDLTTLLSHAEQGSSFVTSHTLSTDVRPEYLFTADNFVFGLAEFDHLSTEGLYLRQTYGGGYGRDLIKSSRTTFSLLGGLTFVHEKFFTGAYDQTAQGLVGEKLGMQLTKRVRLDHDVNFYPNLSDTGQYRFDTATMLSAKLAGKFSLNSGVIDLYLSNPPAGNKKNDVTFTTGVGYTF